MIKVVIMGLALYYSPLGFFSETWFIEHLLPYDKRGCFIKAPHSPYFGTFDKVAYGRYARHAIKMKQRLNDVLFVIVIVIVIVLRNHNRKKEGLGLRVTIKITKSFFHFHGAVS